MRDRSHALRGNALQDAPRPNDAERHALRYHAERGNDHAEMCERHKLRLWEAARSSAFPDGNCFAFGELLEKTPSNQVSWLLVWPALKSHFVVSGLSR